MPNYHNKKPTTAQGFTTAAHRFASSRAQFNTYDIFAQVTATVAQGFATAVQG